MGYTHGAFCQDWIMGSNGLVFFFFLFFRAMVPLVEWWVYWLLLAIFRCNIKQSDNSFRLPCLLIPVEVLSQGKVTTYKNTSRIFHPQP